MFSSHHDHAVVILVFSLFFFFSFYSSCPSSLIAMYWRVRRFFFDRYHGHDAGSAETPCQGSAFPNTKEGSASDGRKAGTLYDDPQQA